MTELFPDHLMIDLETVSTRSDALVLSIGAVKFQIIGGIGAGKPTFGQSILLRPSLREQLAKGRHVDMSTVVWWTTQTPAARASWLAEAEEDSLDSTMYRLSDFATGCGTVWAHGTDFDIGVIRSLYAQSNFQEPWKYNAVRDVRTIFRAIPMMRAMPEGLTFVEHDAIDDCRNQVWRLWERLEHIH